MADKVSKFIFPVKSGNTIANKEFDVGGSGDTNTFVGTMAEWNALTTEQQNAYNCRVLTDDELPTVDVIDNLNSDSSTDALSAKQGKVLKGLVDKTQAQVSNSSDAYNPTKSYKIGDLCIYNNVLYRCVTACSAGSWATNQSCFTQDTLAGVINRSNTFTIRTERYNTTTVNIPASTTMSFDFTTPIQNYFNYNKNKKFISVVGVETGNTGLVIEAFAIDPSSKSYVRVYNPTTSSLDSEVSVKYLVQNI